MYKKVQVIILWLCFSGFILGQKKSLSKLIHKKELLSLENYSISEIELNVYENELYVIGIMKDRRGVCIWDINGVLIDSIYTSMPFKDIIKVPWSYHYPQKSMQVFLITEEECQLFYLRYEEKKIILVEEELLGNKGSELLKLKMGLYEGFEGFQIQYKLNKYQKNHLLNQCFDAFLKPYVRDSIIYIPQMGSFYSLNEAAPKSRKLEYFQENIWLSKKLAFWDQIIFVNKSETYYLYYAPLKCQLFFDKLNDCKEAILIPTNIDSYQCREEVFEYERVAKYLKHYWDNESNKLYFCEEYKENTFRIQRIHLKMD